MRSAFGLSVRFAWQQQVSCDPALKHELAHRESELFPLFVRRYQELLSLPRRTRRSLERQWKQSLSGIALLLTVHAASAAIINVGDNCSLVNAIKSANGDTTVGGCADGFLADTIVLPTNSRITLTAADNSPQNPNGLPVIETSITIEGNGSTIRRDPGAPRFRIFAVGPNGRLTLRSATVSGGRTMSADPLSRAGGGILNVGGTVFLYNSTISRNSARYGGGVFNGNDVDNNPSDSGDFFSYYSTIVGNSARAGGGLENYLSNAVLQNTTISNNTAQFAGGLFEVAGASVLRQVTVTGNTSAIAAGGILNAGDLMLIQSLISGNTAPGAGKELYNYPGGDIAGPGVVVANNFNLFGRNGNAGLYNFSPGTSDLTGSGPVSSIVAPMLNFDSGNAASHALVSGSQAIDAIPAGNCATSRDQRNGGRPSDGDGDSIAECDIGAIEQESDPIACDLIQATSGCTVNGAVGQLCRGTAGNDTIIGTGGNDVIIALGGNDLISAGSGDDRICAGPGNDQVNGEEGNDRVFGDAGNDALKGKEDNDFLFGGAGSDACGGGSGTSDRTKGCETLSGVP